LKATRTGKQNTKHKPAITTPDLQKLRVHPVISGSTPLDLLKMFGSTQPYIGVDEVEKANETEHLPALLLRLHDENSRQYATLTHDELSKNHPGVFDDTESFEKDGRMYRALELYISKLNPHCSAFFQFPK
jgi:hypothetical protein